MKIITYNNSDNNTIARSKHNCYDWHNDIITINIPTTIIFLLYSPTSSHYLKGLTFFSV